MISVEEALEKVLANVRVLEAEEKPILECLGQVLAENVYSSLDIPPLDNSAMDGYAILAKDTLGASSSSPRYLEVVDEVAAGHLSLKEVIPGAAIRIMTGAPVPEGADTVVQYEDTDEETQRCSDTERISRIGILKEMPKGLNIRRAGEDIRKGQLVIQRGTVLRPQEIGVLASVGYSVVSVIRRPLVAVLATGDELVDIGAPLSPGKIYNSNSFSVAAQVKRYGGIPKVLGIAPDEMSILISKIEEGLDCDMFITTAGVSTGEYDMVKDVLVQKGDISFWRVQMKPGKPLAFGVLRGKGGKAVPLLGLPGNPVSAMITFEQFARPAILKMLGKRKLAKPTVNAIIQDSMRNRDGRRVFARAFVRRENGTYVASLTGPQGSGILTSMIQANGLAVIPEDKHLVIEGDLVEVQMLDWEEDQLI